MEMQPVESSDILAIGYDPAAQALVVQFRGGSTYRYNDVPQAVYDGLRDAPSKGRFLAQVVVRNKAYACAKLPQDGAGADAAH